jgi:hypothetical protein
MAGHFGDADDKFQDQNDLSFNEVKADLYFVNAFPIVVVGKKGLLGCPSSGMNS